MENKIKEQQLKTYRINEQLICLKEKAAKEIERDTKKIVLEQRQLLSDILNSDIVEIEKIYPEVSHWVRHSLELVVAEHQLDIMKQEIEIETEKENN